MPIHTYKNQVKRVLETNLRKFQLKGTISLYEQQGMEYE